MNTTCDTRTGQRSLQQGTYKEQVQKLVDHVDKLLTSNGTSIPKYLALVLSAVATTLYFAVCVVLLIVAAGVEVAGAAVFGLTCAVVLGLVVSAVLGLIGALALGLVIADSPRHVGAFCLGRIAFKVSK